MPRLPGMTSTRRLAVPADQHNTPATVEEQYLFLAVESHMADRLRDRQAAHTAAARFADEHGLDEAALEPKVLDAVTRELTDAQLHDCLRDPSTRARARAELTRRAQS